MLKDGMYIQDRYEILGRIGSGGMADVYKAKDHKLNRFVAIKVLKKEFREDKEFVKRFTAEAQAAARLTHPNIVNVYDAGEENNINFIVMELIEGVTLKDFIRKKKRLTIKETTSIALQVAMGLQAAHNNGIVHRDIKPQNIIISKDGKVKVMDFGIARSTSTNTISSVAMGSVHYSSPEQARGGYSDNKSDIYSLGITMYEMLTGHVPFDGDTTVEVAIKHLQEEMVPPTKYVPDLPKAIVQIVEKCTKKSADRRYQNMKELIRDLKLSLKNPNGDFVVSGAALAAGETVEISREELSQIQQKRDLSGSSSKSMPDSKKAGYTPDYEPASEKSAQKPVDFAYDDDDTDDDTDDEERYDAYYNDDANDDGINPTLEKVLTVGSVVIGLLILGIAAAMVANAMGWLHFGNRVTKEIETEVASETSLSASATPNPTLTITPTPQTTPSITVTPTPALTGTITPTPEAGSDNSGASDGDNSSASDGNTSNDNSSADNSGNDDSDNGNSDNSGNTSDNSSADNGNEDNENSGGDSASVPEMYGMTMDEAAAAVSGMGYDVVEGGSYYDEDVPAGQIIWTEQSGSTIYAYVSMGSESGSSDNGNTDNGNTGNGNADNGNTGNGNTDNENTNNGNTDNGNTDNGNTDNGNTDNGNTDNGNTDNGNTDNGNTDDGSATMPNVLGMDIDSAQSALADLGISYTIDEEVSTAYDKGTVMSQSISGGDKVGSGMTVTITVSAGTPDPEEFENWTCNTSLSIPGYNGEQVRIVLEQNGSYTTIVEGTTVSSPYYFSATGAAGATDGTVYIYLYNSVSGSYDTEPYVYYVTFSQVY